MDAVVQDLSTITFMYLYIGYSISCVVKGSKYRKYVLAPSVLRLRHPVSRYVGEKRLDFPLGNSSLRW